jgi:uncharacterized protein (UPF0332 family)
VTLEAASRFAKAERFLAQARSQRPESAPEAAIHLAYYAMLHAAASLLLDRTSEVPKTHSAIISPFSQPVSGDMERGRAFARALNRAEELRLIADYEDRVVPTEADVAQLQSIAVDFVAYCRSLL